MVWAFTFFARSAPISTARIAVSDPSVAIKIRLYIGNPASLVGRVNDQNVTRRVVRDGVGHATEHETLRASHAAVPNHDHIGVLLVGDVDDRVDRISLAEHCAQLDVHAVALLPPRRAAAARRATSPVPPAP